MSVLRKTLTGMAVALVALWSGMANAESVGVEFTSSEAWDVSWDGVGNPSVSVMFSPGALVNSARYNPDDIFSGGDDEPGWLTANGNPGGLLLSYHTDSTPAATITLPNPISSATGWTTEFAFCGHPTASDGAASALNKILCIFGDEDSGVELRSSTTAGYSAVYLGANLPPGNTSPEVAVDLRDYNVFRLVRYPGTQTVHLFINNSCEPASSIQLTTCVFPACDDGNRNHAIYARSTYEAAWDFFQYKPGAVNPCSQSVEDLGAALAACEANCVDCGDLTIAVNDAICDALSACKIPSSFAEFTVAATAIVNVAVNNASICAPSDNATCLADILAGIPGLIP